MPVNLRLARSEQIEIGAIQYEDKIGQFGTFASEIIGQADAGYGVGTFLAEQGTVLVAQIIGYLG